MQYRSKSETTEKKHSISEVSAALEKFLEGDNKALARMLKVVDITRTDVQRPGKRLKQ